MAITQLQSTSIADGAITTDKIAADVSLSITVSNVSIANSTYHVLDDTAVNVGGGYIVITGNGFQSGAQVLINRDEATSVTFVDSTTLKAQVPAKAAATYNLYVVNPDGGVAIRVNGLTYSGIPTWVTGSTLDNQAVDVAFNLNFDATDATSYANTTTLPAGTALLSNGYFYGTVTGIAEETTYNFTVSAIDNENQDAYRTFSVTVTVGPPPGYLYAWGANYNGSLGRNLLTPYTVSSPVQIGSDLWSSVSHDSGATGSFFIKSDGSLWVAGWNTEGNLGLNTGASTIYRSSPTQIGSLTNWSIVNTSNFRYTMAIKTDGTLWSWGQNGKGQLGHNDTANKSSPTQVGTDTNWSTFALGAINTYGQNVAAIKTDGTLWTWGCGELFGALGHNDAVNKSSPTQVGTDTNWASVDCGRPYMMAVKTDGSLYGWGRNVFGNLGLNNSIDRFSSPVQVGGTWTMVSCSDYVSIGIKTDGSLWTWGTNNQGALGINLSYTSPTYLQKSSPTQVGTDTTWTNALSCYPGSMFALKSDGTIWSWGENTYHGQLGHNDAITKSSPTQIGSSTSWIQIYGGYQSIFALRT